MSLASHAFPVSTKRPKLSVFDPDPAHVQARPATPPTNEATWRINGYAAKIVVWTQAEWERMAIHPADAQFYPCGIWCALRIE